MLMGKIENYQSQLQQLTEWEEFMLAESGLPGPRGNLELIEAAARMGSVNQFTKWVQLSEAEAPGDKPPVILVCSGLVGLGRLITEGSHEHLTKLHSAAEDPRWRVREATAMALQKIGDYDVDFLLTILENWQQDSLLVQRAIVAAICEPRLLKNTRHAEQVVALLDHITQNLLNTSDRKTEPFRILKQALSYGWSVATAAYPEKAKKQMEQWMTNNDKDIKKIMAENLKKNRLIKMDSHWVEMCLTTYFNK